MGLAGGPAGPQIWQGSSSILLSCDGLVGGAAGCSMRVRPNGPTHFHGLVKDRRPNRPGGSLRNRNEAIRSAPRRSRREGDGSASCPRADPRRGDGLPCHGRRCAEQAQSGRQAGHPASHHCLRDPLISHGVEHPFGTIKAWMGATHFQIRHLRNVHTEMALHVLADNIKRMIELYIGPLLHADPHLRIGNPPPGLRSHRRGECARRRRRGPRTDGSQDSRGSSQGRRRRGQGSSG